MYQNSRSSRHAAQNSQHHEVRKSETSHIYQLYSYLRSQERSDDPRSLNSEGMLLYPAIKFDVDEAAEIQGHLIRFATIDLGAPTTTVVERLRQLPLASRIRQTTCDPAENRLGEIA